MVQYISYTLHLYTEAVPRRILEKMNEKMNVPEVSREKVASHLQVIIIYINIIHKRPHFITN